jgi:4-amino-4-deoxy-L-arabinose transferase-like glycosyltransferase
MKNLIKKHFLFLFFLIFYLGTLSIKLIYHPLPFYDWDEAIYMEVGREMIKNKSFIPLWQEKLWFDKPPLVMLLYGLIPKISPLIEPEISARLFNLFLTIIFFIILYRLILKITNSTLTAFLTVFLSSFTPLFIQRAHTVNMDVFLALGWWGYFLFYPNFLLSTLILSLAIFSKSLLGFYPLFIAFFYELFNFFIKKNDFKKFLNHAKNILTQLILFSLWYLWMFLKFGYPFLYQHIYESHFKRVTASIEFHFGQRIFYFAELAKQLDIFFYLSLLGLFLIFLLFTKKRITFEKLFFLNLFLPWFLFLNLTKTKIYWYLYPAIPQFSLYVGFLVNFLQKTFHHNISKKAVFIFALLAVSYFGIKKNNFFLTTFSSEDKYYQMALYAKNHCQKIYFLPEKSHRQAVSELEKMGLTITTTRFWGGHPALVYYTDNKIVFIYNFDKFKTRLKDIKEKECFSFFENEIDEKIIKNKVKLIIKFEDIILVKLL